MNSFLLSFTICETELVQWVVSVCSFGSLSCRGFWCRVVLLFCISILYVPNAIPDAATWRTQLPITETLFRKLSLTCKENAVVKGKIVHMPSAFSLLQEMCGLNKFRSRLVALKGFAIELKGAVSLSILP